MFGYRDVKLKFIMYWCVIGLGLNINVFGKFCLMCEFCWGIILCLFFNELKIIVF